MVEEKALAEWGKGAVMHSETPSNQIKREILKTHVRGKVKRCFHLVNTNPPKNCRGSEVN